MKKSVLKKFTSFFVIFVLVLGVPSFIALCPFIYFKETSKVNSTIDDVDSLYVNVHDFLVFQKPLSDKFDENETSHMNDVRFVFNFLRLFSFFFLSILVYEFIRIRKNYKLKNFKNSNYRTECLIFLKKIRLGIIISLFLALLLIFFVLINFDFAFNIFHKIFFPQGNWQFPFDSLLISIFPSGFFYNYAKKIIISSISIVILLLGFIYFLENKIRHAIDNKLIKKVKK